MKMLQLALYQPEIPHNTGTLMRLGACLNVPIDLIEPLGFVYDDARLKRAGMDYLERAHVTRQPSFSDFHATRKGRLILLDVQSSHSFYDFSFQAYDTLLLGRESDGVPEHIRHACDHRITIPMMPHTRSLNMAIAASMVLGEAIRQVRKGDLEC
jgi:tRNA (cytidine/uridine-2'-O-)-methyltransferase